MSESHKNNIVAINNLINRNKKITSESFSEEHRKKISIANSGRKQSKKHVEKLMVSRSKKPILQFDLDNNLIREWKSAAEIKRVLGYDPSNISRACKDRNNIIRNRNRRTAYTFYWEYKITTA